MSEPIADHLVAALSGVSTSTITGQLQKRGIRNSFFAGLTPLGDGQRMIGRARTLRFLPMREDLVPTLQQGFNAQRWAIEDLQPGDVLVIDARNEPGAATLGDVFAMRAKVRGAAGVVTDGGVRDGAAVAGIDIPVYCRAVHGATFSRQHLPVDMDIPVSCAGVLVMPGDVIVGDEDGAVLIPAALVDEVAADAAEQELRDTWAFERVQAGDHVQEVFPMAASRVAEFEAWKTNRLS